MQVEIAGAVTDLGTDAATVGAFQRVIIQMNLQLRPRGLLYTTVSTSIVLDSRMSHHVHLQQLLAGETSSALSIFTYIGQLRLVLVGEAMILEAPHGVERFAAELTDMRLGLLAQLVALAHVHAQRVLVAVSTVTARLGARIRHVAVLSHVRLQAMLLQELCGADVALINVCRES